LSIRIGREERRRERLRRLGSEEKAARALASRSRSVSMAALESVGERKEKRLVVV